MDVFRPFYGHLTATAVSCIVLNAATLFAHFSMKFPIPYRDCKDVWFDDVILIWDLIHLFSCIVSAFYIISPPELIGG